MKLKAFAEHINTLAGMYPDIDVIVRGKLLNAGKLVRFTTIEACHVSESADVCDKCSHLLLGNRLVVSRSNPEVNAIVIE